MNVVKRNIILIVKNMVSIDNEFLYIFLLYLAYVQHTFILTPITSQSNVLITQWSNKAPLSMPSMFTGLISVLILLSDSTNFYALCIISSCPLLRYKEMLSNVFLANLIGCMLLVLIDICKYSKKNFAFKQIVCCTAKKFTKCSFCKYEAIFYQEKSYIAYIFNNRV